MEITVEWKHLLSTLDPTLGFYRRQEMNITNISKFSYHVDFIFFEDRNYDVKPKNVQ